jgi:hypothetical protein
MVFAAAVRDAMLNRPIEACPVGAGLATGDDAGEDLGRR